MPDKILIVDDDPVQRRLLQGQATRLGYNVTLASGGTEALEILAKSPRRFAVLVLDLIMPDVDGLGVLEAMRERRIGVPVVVQTAQGGIDTVVSAMRAGAFDFVVKPVSPERLQVSLAKAVKVGSLTDEVTRVNRTARGRITFDDIIASAPAMERIIAIGRKAAKSQIPVLIEGESGVGKEMIARAIQGTSERSSKPFITVNCGALPENLVESILFGHEKGAFTGATDKHVGKFEEANGGTLFLDEVGELPPEVQVKLLRAIQEGEIDPVGARRPVKVDFRLISATNKNLLTEVEAGRFREDLYYRLNVLAMTVPPLRERRTEIPALTRHFLKRFAETENRSGLNAIAADAETMLFGYDWPGNIRQLENAMFRAVVLADGDRLTVEEFPQIAAQAPGFELPEPEPDRAASVPRAAAPELAPPMHDADETTVAPDMMRLLSEEGQVRSLEELEAETIRFAIDHYKGRMSEVARRLGIGRSTLYRKLRDYGLEEASSDSRRERA